MRNYDCPFECSDDDCYMCSIHGHRFSCEGCVEYEEMMNPKKGDEK